MVAAKKPDPAIYNLAAKTLALDPRNCVVIEDSHIGLTAAKAAGMNCVVTKSFLYGGRGFQPCRHRRERSRFRHRSCPMPRSGGAPQLDTSSSFPREARGRWREAPDGGGATSETPESDMPMPQTAATRCTTTINRSRGTAPIRLPRPEAG